MQKSNKFIEEFDVDSTFGFTMKGWDFSSIEVLNALEKHLMLNPAFELGTNVCPWNCSFCFTEKAINKSGRKRPYQNELSLERRIELIKEAAKLGTKSINIIGAGEPTIDPHFLTLIKEMRKHEITPIVYSEGTIKLSNKYFAKLLYDLGVTIVLKFNSFHNDQYQNAIVEGIGDYKPSGTDSYTTKRNKVLDTLQNVGFNVSKPTRLALNTIICKQNKNEILEIHDYARLHNIFVIFVNYLPSGRCREKQDDAIGESEKLDIFSKLAKHDKEYYNMSHKSIFPYSGGIPCTIRGLGLYVKINGLVYDCPAESRLLGDLKENSLKELWSKTRQITNEFDGMCAPRCHN
jgi:MoaA/NifB/PqqE/SkfB family radical SAM enzyme